MGQGEAVSANVTVKIKGKQGKAWISRGGYYIGEIYSVANAKRIEACWNTCAGMTDDELRAISEAGGVKGIAKAYSDLGKQIAWYHEEHANLNRVLTEERAAAAKLVEATHQMAATSAETLRLTQGNQQALRTDLEIVTLQRDTALAELKRGECDEARAALENSQALLQCVTDSAESNVSMPASVRETLEECINRNRAVLDKGKGGES